MTDMTAEDKNKGRGVFIVIEGLDRSGKSTQVAALLERLESLNIPTKHIRFPDRTTAIGKTIDAYLRSETDVDDHAIHLLFSANRWELAPTIERTLNSGTAIICDRYAFSGIAYSASKSKPPPPPTPTPTSTPTPIPTPTSTPTPTPTTPSQPQPQPQPQHLPFTWCKSPDIGLPSPDLTIFLNISPTQALQRSGFGSERYETEEHQNRVRDVFLRIAHDVKSGNGDFEWVTIDAARSIEDVREDVWKEVERVRESAPKKPIGRLWVSEQS